MLGPGRKEFNAQRSLNYKDQQKQIAGIQKSHQQLSKWQAGEARQQATQKAAQYREQRRQISGIEKSHHQLSKWQSSEGRQRLTTERAVARESAKTHRDKQRQIDQVSRSQQALGRQRRGEESAAGQASARRQAFVKSTFGGAAGKVFGGLAAVGKMGLAATGLGGGALAAASINQALSLDEGSRRLVIAARGRGQSGYNGDTLRKQFTQTGIQFGLSPESVMAGVTSYVAKTGDLNSAMANRDTLATVAQGENASVEDIFGGAAIMKKQMGVSSPEDIGKAYSILTMQGKKGSFELKDAAKELPEVLAQAAGTGLTGVEGVRTVGTLMQLAQDSTENGAETGTAVSNMFRQLKKKAMGIQSGAILGKKVNIYEGGDPTKAMRTDTLPMFQDIISATGGDESKIQDLFDIRGNKAFAQITNAYRKANIANGGGAKGDEAGRAAVQAKWNEYNNVPADFAEIQRDAADAMKSTAVQLEILNTKLKDAVASQLFPAFQRMVPELEKLIPLIGRAAEAFVNLITFLANDPFTAIGTIVAGWLALELGKAALSDGIAKILALLAGKVTGGGGPGLLSAPGIPGMPVPTTMGGKILTGAGKALGGALVGGALGAGIGGMINGADGAETGAFVGGGAGAGLMLGGPLGAAVGGAWGAVADQAKALASENGGWDFWNGDEKMNKAAKERRAKDDALAAKGGGGTSVSGKVKDVAASLDEFDKGLAKVNAQFSKINLDGINRSDKPTGGVKYADY